MTTEPDQRKWVGIRLVAGEAALPVSMSATSIQDTDNDTKFQTEEGGDDDTARIDAGGSEIATFKTSGVEIKAAGTKVTVGVPVVISDGAGQYFQLPTLTTAQRDALTPVNGMLIYNSTTGDIERYEDAAWSALGAGTPALIEDADQDTKVQTEESADEDMIRMDVEGVEAFNLDSVGILTLAKQSGAKGYLNTAQDNISSGSWVKVLLDAESYDIQNEFDTANKKFTVTVAGYYLIIAMIMIGDFAVDKNFGINVYVNGGSVAYAYFTFAVVGNFSLYVSDVLSLAASDYVELYFYSGDAGNSVDLSTGGNKTYMSIAKLR